MWPVMPYLSSGASQADAIFASRLQHGDEPSAGQVRQAVAAARRSGWRTRRRCWAKRGRVAAYMGAPQDESMSMGAPHDESMSMGTPDKESTSMGTPDD